MFSLCNHLNQLYVFSIYRETTYFSVFSTYLPYGCRVTELFHSIQRTRWNLFRIISIYDCNLYVCVFYLKNSFLFTRPITKSSLIVSIGTMLLTILIAIGSEEFAHASILFLAFGFIALITYKHTQNETLKKVSLGQTRLVGDYHG